MQPRPTFTPRESTEPIPRPPVAEPSLVWQSENTIAGLCQQLRIDAQGSIWYGRCDQPLQVATLTAAEFAAYEGYLAAYAPFSYVSRRTPDPLQNVSVRVQLIGRGTRMPDDEEQARLATWVAQVYDRVVRRQLEGRLVALAQANLAGRLGISSAAIRPISVDSVTWADVCLGIPSSTTRCDRYPTPGLRVILEAGGEVYEYRTDLLGLVVPFGDLPSGPPTLPLPTAGPTATAAPTSIPTAAVSATLSAVPTSAPTAVPTPSPTPLIITDWRGEYYANTSLSGSPSLIRNDRELRFDWGGESPDPGVPVDYFSARWSRIWRFSAGSYRFSVRADDGVRLWVAGDLLLDRWSEGYNDADADVYVPAGSHEIVLEYFEAGGLAEVALDWGLSPATPTPTWEPYTSYWRGAYYDNVELRGAPVRARSEDEIDFDWGTGRPFLGFPRDYFSVRWTRRLYFTEGAYRFRAHVDDGVRIWVDDAPVIDEWRRGAVTAFEGYIWLDEGEHNVRVEYFEDTSEAVIEVDWERLIDLDRWIGVYYANPDLEGAPVLVRADDKLSFDWGQGSPDERLPVDGFSARWTRTAYFSEGRHRFRVRADDGVRLYVDDVLLIDEWHESPGTTYERSIDLDASSYRITVEYYERGVGARLKVEWERG
ncbi:MAG: hypothetical protein JXA74_06450 [Anaerolineae bacterium]|nr:hypothetical protein [Anaerolineae bacterium]